MATTTTMVTNCYRASRFSCIILYLYLIILPLFVILNHLFFPSTKPSLHSQSLPEQQSTQPPLDRNYSQNNESVLAVQLAMRDATHQKYNLHPPASSSESYNLKNPTAIGAQNFPMIQFIQDILRKNGVAKGFFVEAGAHDGEFISNTLYLEKDFGWTGLLVEPDPVAFESLLKKRRRSWAANVCLSRTKSENNVNFEVSKKHRVLGRVVTNLKPKYKWNPKATEQYQVKCVPLVNLLIAINISVVDFFSLDVEGVELDVLKTIPFDKIHFKVLAVEHNLIRNGPRRIEKLMTSRKYRLVNPEKYLPAYNLKSFKKSAVLDSVFVHESLQFLVT